MVNERVIETNVPARMDRLPWSGWHRKIVLALVLQLQLGALL